MRTMTIGLGMWSLAACAGGPAVSERDAAGPAATVDPANAGVLLEAWIVELSGAQSDELLGDADGARVHPGRIAEDVRLLATRDDQVTIVARPRLVLADGAEGEIASVQREDYVKDYERDAGGAWQPVRGTLEEGVWLEARPTVGEDSSIRLELVVRRSTVHRPLREVEIELAGTRETVRLQLPEVETRTITDVAELRPGECWVAKLDALDSAGAHRVRGAPEDRRRTIAIVTSSIVELPQEIGFRVSTESAVHEAAATR